VKTVSKDELDRLPAHPYPTKLCDQRVAAVYQHVFERM